MVQPAWPIIKFLVKKLGVVQESLKTLKFSQDQKQQEKNPDSTMNQSITNTYSVLAGHSVLPCLISPKRCNQKEIQAALHHYIALFQTFSSDMSQAGE